MSIVEEELAAPVNAIFDRFDYEPIAAASLGNLDFLLTSCYKEICVKVAQVFPIVIFIFFVVGKAISRFRVAIADKISTLKCCYLFYTGQVHRARLKGQEVVIKVQRPGLKDLFDIDLKNLRVSFLIGIILLVVFLFFYFCEIVIIHQI